MSIKRFNWPLWLLSYGALRIFSFYFPPHTPLHDAHFLNEAFSATVILLTAYWLIKNDLRGWLLIAMEIILGGAGGFFSLGDHALRTWLLGISLIIYVGHLLFDPRPANVTRIDSVMERLKWNDNKETVFVLCLLLGVVSFGALRGFFAHHALNLILSEVISYCFLLYFFPLREILTGRQKTKFKQFLFNALIIAIIGNCIFILLTLIGFSTGQLVMPGTFYHWFRDVALGKITELPFHFFRLVLNEHLILVPTLIYLLHRIINQDHEVAKSDYRVNSQNNKITESNEIWKLRNSEVFLFPNVQCPIPNFKFPNFLIPLLLILILSINLTRIYLLALIVGLLFLFTKKNWKRWLWYSTMTIIVFILSFSAIHLTASRGQSLGWNLLGLRLDSIVNPELENSSLSRLLLLPKIEEKIFTNPLLGNGLGDTITVYNPILKNEITTPQFDWGYLQIIEELGLLGFVVWLIFIAYGLHLLKERSLIDRLSYSVPLAALLIINITSPALFHVLGVIWLMYGLSSNNTKRFLVDNE